MGFLRCLTGEDGRGAFCGKEEDWGGGFRVPEVSGRGQGFGGVGLSVGLHGM